MAKPKAKPAPVDQQQPARPDPMVGRQVPILRGKDAGKMGVARRCYRGRVATPDTVHVEQEGGLPGWYVAVPIYDVEVVQ